jgi:hypothetical protein
MKTVAQQRKARFRGIDRTGCTFTFVTAAYNLVRRQTLLPQVASNQRFMLTYGAFLSVKSIWQHKGCREEVISEACQSRF